MQIYNARFLDSRQKFLLAALAGIVTAIVCGLVYGFIVRMFGFEMSAFHAAIGYAVGYAVRRFGRGVHQRFAILAAVCTVLAIFIGDVSFMMGPGVLLRPMYWGEALRAFMYNSFSTSLHSLLGLLFRGYGVYAAYQTGRIL